MSTRLHATVRLIAVAAAMSSCIAPPAASCPCSETAAASGGGGGGGDAPAAKSSSGGGDSSGPAPVKPGGTLLSDGKSTTIQNVDPPGSWFVFNDKSAKGTMTPASTGEFATSGLANGGIHTDGKGFTDWGGGIGVNFVGADTITPMDASGYSGISFKASGSTAMHVGLATKATMPEFSICTKCYDHFAVDITDLSGTPKSYSFKWGQLHAAGWGAPKAQLDPHTLIGLNFTSKGGVPWNFTITELSLVK
jgi:hypothetical protein